MTNTQTRYISAEEMAFHAARARALRAEAARGFFAGLFSLFRSAPAARIRATSLVTAK
ncbi:hypothetical protein [Ferrovibrio sp.]|jgi:hypothetical protein|uniref:hypothetical protein n=1 Tax=Ferrovibrio sp. TaxID=1917215 RepID=UPI0035B0DA08